MSGPIEVKVSAATIATAVSGLGMWALQTYAFGGDVPPAVEAAVATVVPAVVAFLAGWLAPHTPRPDLQVTQADIADAHVNDDDPGDHALDGDAGEIPVVNLTQPQHRRR